MQIKDSVAIVVGGASGMARATAELLADEGARVAIFDLESSAGEEVAKALPGDAIFRPIDIMDYDGVGARRSKTRRDTSEACTSA